MHVYCFCGFVRIYLLPYSPKVKISSRTHPNEPIHWISSEFWRILTLSLSCQKPFWSFSLIIIGGTSSLQCFLKISPEIACIQRMFFWLMRTRSISLIKKHCFVYFILKWLCYAFRGTAILSSSIAFVIFDSFCFSLELPF